MSESVLDVAIIDYKMSNLHSVQAACRKVGLKSEITFNQDLILKAKAAILPGVGAFGEAMVHIRELKLDRCIKDFIETGKPFVGICLGMQLLTNVSEEGNMAGLGWIDSDTKRFDFNNQLNNKLKIPHVGWSKIYRKKDSLLLKDIPDDHKFYFTHSYYVVCNNENDVVATTKYGLEFSSVVQKDNIYGTQFHPEKSHINGLTFLKNYFHVIREFHSA